jgi:hypothetical protein
MKQTDSLKHAGHGNRRIIGFSLDPQLATKVKTEAARRGIPLKKLFDELWALYEEQLKKPKQ